jgi:hypothetical protein
MTNTYEITNLTPAGLEVLLAIAAGDDLVLPAGLSNADLDAIGAYLVKQGNDPARVGAWLCSYPRPKVAPGYDPEADRIEGRILARDDY